MNQLRKLRERYESCQDQAEKARAAYHRAIQRVHNAGTPLREIAEQLGLSHQRVHQIVAIDPRKPGATPARKGVERILTAEAIGNQSSSEFATRSRRRESTRGAADEFGEESTRKEDLARLHLVGFTTDLKNLIFATRKGARSGSFLVPIDGRLRRNLTEVDRLELGEGDRKAAKADESGLSTKQRHGDDHFSKIGRLGGKKGGAATKQRYSAEFYQQIGNQKKQHSEKDDPFVEARNIEEAILEIPELRAARLVTGADGNPVEIHVVAGGGKSAKQLAREIQTVFETTFGIDLDHQIISIVQFSEAELDAEKDLAAASRETGEDHPSH